MEQQRTPVQAKLSRKQTAYEYVKEKILSCEYEPGAMMNEQSLCDELVLSRTPVRDALSRLEQEGLVSILPKKGFVVTAMKLGDVNRIYEVRLLLEPYALRRYGHKLDRGELESLRTRMEEQITGADRFGLSRHDYGGDKQPLFNRYLREHQESEPSHPGTVGQSGGEPAGRHLSGARRHYRRLPP